MAVRVGPWDVSMRSSGDLKGCGYLAGILFTPRTWEDRAKFKGGYWEQRCPLEAGRSCRVSCLLGGGNWGPGGPAVLIPLSFTGKNLYTNEYVAIKLVSPGSSPNSRDSSHMKPVSGVWGRRRGMLRSR